MSGAQTKPYPRMTSIRLRRPLIIGHYGGCNTGDEAMLTGLLGAMPADLRRRATVVVKGARNGTLHSAYGAGLVPAEWWAVLRALLRSDGLLLGGGTHFHDDYTTRRYVRHLRYMARITSLSILAKLLGRKVIWLGVGLGPFSRWPTRWITRLGLKCCDRVTVRDAESQREIAAWIPPEKLALTFDLAALLVRDSILRTGQVATVSNSVTTLGVCVTSVRRSLSGGAPVDSVVWRRLAAVLNRTLDKRPDLRLKVMVWRGGSREDDGALSKELHEAVSLVHPARAELVPYSSQPEETLRRVAECDAFIATRYHAGVFAYLAGCRLLFFAYHRKVRDLAREIGLADGACLPLAADLREEVLEEKMGGLMEGSEAFRARLPVPVAARRAWLNIQALEDVQQLDVEASPDPYRLLPPSVERGEEA